MHPLTALLTVVLAVCVALYGVLTSIYSTSTQGSSRIKVDESACQLLEQVRQAALTEMPKMQLPNEAAGNLRQAVVILKSFDMYAACVDSIPCADRQCVLRRLMDKLVENVRSPCVELEGTFVAQTYVALFGVIQFAQDRQFSRCDAKCRSVMLQEVAVKLFLKGLDINVSLRDQQSTQRSSADVSQRNFEELNLKRREKACRHLEQSHKAMLEGMEGIVKNVVSLFSTMDVELTPDDVRYFADVFQQFDAYAFCTDVLRCPNGRCVVRRLGDWIVATFRGSEFSLSCDECRQAMRVLRYTFVTRRLHEATIRMRQDYVTHDDGCDEQCISNLDEFLTEVTTEFKDTDFCEVMKFCRKKESGASLGLGSSIRY